MCAGHFLYIVMRYLLTLTISLFFFLPAFAQNSSLGNWMIYIGNKKLNDKWSIHHEIQYRNYNVIGDLEQLLIRAAVGKSLSKNMKLQLGYGFIQSENYIDTDTKAGTTEHRIYQEMNLKNNYKRLFFGHRYRFEQRWVEGDFRLRFRYGLFLKVPFNNPTLVPKTTYFSFYNEIFVGSTSPIFDRNRVYGALGYKLSNAISLELGYMTQYFERSSRDQMTISCFAAF